jgi:hypothetical protein
MLHSLLPPSIFHFLILVPLQPQFLSEEWIVRTD